MDKKEGFRWSQNLLRWLCYGFGFVSLVRSPWYMGYIILISMVVIAQLIETNNTKIIQIINSEESP